MALIAIHLELMRLARQQLLGDSSGAVSLLSLGYPDPLIAESGLDLLLTKEQRESLAYVEHPEPILQWHGMGGMLPRLVETDSLFKAMGFDGHYIDLHPSRGCEEAVDLNLPLPTHLRNRFRMVLDLGTTEHCFNIGQCMMNIAASLQQGGVVLHSNPIGFYDHGFFNFTPSFYLDFYQQNGFTLHFFRGLTGTPLHYELFDLGPQWKAQPLPAKSIVLAVAQRTQMQEIIWPTQSKYRTNPNLKI